MASSSTIQCSLIDDTFGPWAGACRDSFDFTLLFEESILTIPLLVILICVTPFRLLHLRQRSRKTITGFFLIFKLVRSHREFRPFVNN
jgi:ATP-binding cassette subfamily C (CFTR/MRP) protein 1